MLDAYAELIDAMMAESVRISPTMIEVSYRRGMHILFSAFVHGYNKGLCKGEGKG